MVTKKPVQLIRQKEAQMNAAVKILDFETAAILRDEIAVLKSRIEEKKEKIPKIKTRRKS